MPFQPHNPLKAFDAVGVYIFAGGFTVGMHDYFNIVGHLEDGPFGVDTFRANFQHVPVWTNPVRWPRDRFRGVDVMYGNPPCSPWSPVGRSIRNGRENWREDPNVACARQLIQYGLEQRPRIWVMESVPQIQKSEFLLDMAQTWLDAGYAFTLVREDAKFFGLPQQRRRCFMVAHSVDIEWDPGEVVTTPLTAGEVLETVTEVGPYREVEPNFVEMVKDLGPGGSLRRMWEEMNPDKAGVDGRVNKVVGRPLLMVHRIDPSKVSGVIIGMSVYLHPFEDRYLSHTELAALTGYPPDYEWVNGAPGRGDDRIGQVAKAVTPPAARFLGRNLASALEVNRRAEVKPMRATFWSRSTRVDSFSFTASVEDWDVSHECTLTPSLAV